MCNGTRLRRVEPAPRPRRDTPSALQALALSRPLSLDSQTPTYSLDLRANQWFAPRSSSQRAGCLHGASRLREPCRHLSSSSSARGCPRAAVGLPSDASVHLLAMLRPTWLPPPPERDGRPLLSPGLVPWRARCLRPANSQVRQLPPVLRAPSGPRAERLDPELRSSIDTPLLVPRDVVNPTAMPAKRAVQAGSHHQRPSSQTPRPQGWLPA